MPKVSVIITTYNRPTLLPVAIESAFRAAQQVEVVVVDDASTDATAKVCQSYAGVNYVRVERNQGVAGARNLGILASSTDYINFLDDDDVRVPGSLDLQLAALQSAPEAGMIYGRMIVGDALGKPSNDVLPLSCPQGDIFWKLLQINFIPCGSVVFRKSCLSRVGLLDETIPGLDDWDLWIRIAEIYSVVGINEPVIIWRRASLRSQQQSANTPYMVTKGLHLLRHRWLLLPRVVASCSAFRRRRLWHKCRSGAIHLLLWEAFAQFIPERELQLSYRNVLTALSLSPVDVLLSLFHPEAHSFIRSFLGERSHCSNSSTQIKEGSRRSGENNSMS